MPWRKRAKLLDQLIERLSHEQKPLQSLQVVALVELLAEKILASVRLLMVMCFMLFVLFIGLEIQVQIRNKDIAKIHHIVEQATDPKGPSAQASNAAILEIKSTDERLKAIELKLCGGPCPTPQGGK